MAVRVFFFFFAQLAQHRAKELNDIFNYLQFGCATKDSQFSAQNPTTQAMDWRLLDLL